MRIRKFNESIDNNSVIDDDFADLKDISEIEYPSDESNVYTFSLVIDDHSYFNVDEMLDNNNKINHFIKTFKKCLKNSDFHIVGIEILTMNLHILKKLLKLSSLLITK